MNIFMKAILRILLVIVFSSGFLVPLNNTYAKGIISETDYNIRKQLDTVIKTGLFEDFIDNAFRSNMHKYNIPGAVISVVKDGKIILLKGYGYKDLESRSSVDPNKTLFRIGSVTKLFTADAAMQLSEQGKIDLNRDITDYIKDIKIKNKYHKKITMAQLLTHTSGFDSDVIGDLSVHESQIKFISEFLKRRMLPVVSEPGLFIQYSSYGIALAGSIIENISGTSCGEYIVKNIFTPLGMTNTSFQMNSKNLSKGYIAIDNKLKQMKIKGYFNLYPVGGIVSTAEDMAKYMLAHLNYGEFNGHRIHNKDTSDIMHSRHTSFDPILPGVCYGFYEGIKNGQRIIGHEGYSPDGFSTELCLIPEYNLGIFISVNQGYNNSFPQEFIDDFTAQYLKNEVTDVSTVSNGIITEAATDKSVAGIYRFSDYTKSTLNKGDMFGIFTDLRVSALKDGSIKINETDPFSGKKSVSHAFIVKKGIYKKADGSFIVFKQDKKGKVAYLAQTKNSWHGVYNRINWYDSNSFQIILFLVLVFLSFYITIYTIVSLIIYIKKRKEFKNKGLKLAALIKAGMGLISILNIMFYGISMLTWGERLRYGVPLDIKLILLLPLLTAFLTIGLVAAIIACCKKKTYSMFFRINMLIATLTGFAFIWVYNYWNLLGFKY